MDLEPQPHLTSKGASSKEGETLIPVAPGRSGEERLPLERLLGSRFYVLADKSLGLLGIFLFFLAWEIASRTHILNPFYFPPFSQNIFQKEENTPPPGPFWGGVFFFFYIFFL